MKTDPMKAAYLFVLYFAATLAVRAELMVGASLEWLADTSICAGVFKVTHGEHKSESAFELTFRLHETLKGTPPQTVNSSYWVRLPKDSEPPAVSIEDRFLVFLKPDEEDTLHVAHLINLSTPQNGGMDSMAITSKFQVLTIQAQILKLVRERIKSSPNAITTKWQEYPNSRFDVDVPMDSPAFKILFAGSACYLLVPDDLKKENTKKPNKSEMATPRKLSD